MRSTIIVKIEAKKLDITWYLWNEVPNEFSFAYFIRDINERIIEDKQYNIKKENKKICLNFKYPIIINAIDNKLAII